MLDELLVSRFCSAAILARSSSSTNEEAKVIAYQEETVVKEVENGTDRLDLKPPAEELDPSQNQEA